MKSDNDNDRAARELYEASSADYRHRLSWNELSEETRQFYRDKARERR
jgi:hypothetical protein